MVVILSLLLVFGGVATVNANNERATNEPCIDYVVRAIEKDDAPQVYSFLQDLVKHEGLESSFCLTYDRMYHELFKKGADWHCLVAAHGSVLIGCCFYTIAHTNRAFNHTPVLHIDDLYVFPAYHRMGVGKALMRAVALIAFASGIDRIELLCVKDNNKGQQFYTALGGRTFDLLDFYQLDVAHLMKTLKK